MLKVATDGGCNPSTRIGAWAWISENGYYASGCILDSTNNIAELTALEKALEIRDDLEIIYDSQYAVNSITVWGKAWRNDPKKAKKKKNLEQIFRIMDLLEDRKRSGLETNFTWQKSHTKGDKDTVEKLLNHYADKLCAKMMKLSRAHEISGVQFEVRKQIQEYFKQLNE